MEREKQHQCKYCYFQSTDLDIIKTHEEEIHGCFRDVNTRKIKSKPKSKCKAPEGDIVSLSTGGVCKWDGQRYVGITSTKAKYPLNKDQPDKVPMGDGSCKYKCLNCGRYSKFLLDPYTCFSLPQNKRIRVSKNAYPLILCPSCGLNIFKDNRLRVYEWLNKKVDRNLPKGIDLDVMLSAVTPDNKGVIRSDKLNEIL